MEGVDCGEKCIFVAYKLLNGKNVKWYTDNQNVVSIVSKGSTKSVLQKLALDIFSTCIKHNVNIDMVWIPRTENERADYLSRIIDSDDWAISEFVFQIVESLWGPHEVDWFASDDNFKLHVFYSRFWNVNSSGVDAFTVDWRGINGLFVPPVSLIPRVLMYMRQCKAVGTLILPYWPSASFWPMLCPFGDGFISEAFAGELQNLPVSLLSKVNLLPELLSESRAASTTKGYYQSFLRWKKWAILNGIENCDILPAKAFHVAIYLASLTQSSNTVSPVVQAFYSLKWIHSLIGSLCSPTDSSLVINVLEGAKRSLATPTNKKEPISVELLHKMKHPSEITFTNPIKSVKAHADCFCLGQIILDTIITVQYVHRRLFKQFKYLSMASRYIQIKDNIPAEISADVLQIPAGDSSTQVIKPDIDDEKKRWLVVGICIHSVISPTLRPYVASVMKSLYSSMQQTIHNQVYPKHLRKYPPTNKDLNYEAVNNNRSIPYIPGKRQIANYNYDVQNEVDFSKLFLLTNMANYKGFDHTCDSTALLGLLINVDKFPSNVKKNAEKIRSDIRNPWAHCDFTEWDSIKYLSSFQMMNQLIKNLKLPTTDEIRVIGELQIWESNGIQFLQGNTIGLNLLEEITKQTKALARYVLKATDETDESFRKVENELFSIHDELSTFSKRIKKIESNQELFSTAVEKSSNDIADLKDKAASMTIIQEDNSKQNTVLNERVTKIEEDIEMFKYNSCARPEGKVFFYPPDRIKCFVGRCNEIENIQSHFMKNKDEQFTFVICGLGGCGKTTVALEYSWKFQDFYQGGVFWMSAESNETLETSVSILAIDINTSGKTSKETLFRTLKWIASLPNQWLLVVDNVDAEEISGNTKDLLLGTWKRNTKGHILITSRREPRQVEESLHVAENNCLYLNVLTNEEGLTFMKTRNGKNKDDENETILNLVEELGGLPLALEQAGAYIKTKNCSFKQYLDKFILLRQKLLNALHQYREDALSIHRLVQEIIRDTLKDSKCVKLILQFAARMINKALESTVSPYEALCINKSNPLERGSLYLWSKLALNSNILKGHILNFTRTNTTDLTLHLNIEIARLFHTTAIFHSIHQRQDEALADQEQLLNIMTAIDIPDIMCTEFTSVKIPLLEKERNIILNFLSSVVPLHTELDNTLLSDRTESLRIKGNESFENKRYHDAIQYYTEGIRSSKEVDFRLYSNRCLTYLRVNDNKNALKDAEQCLELDCTKWKAHCWKAYSIANLVRNGQLPLEFEKVGLASACVAANINDECLLKYKMKINYPIVVYKVLQHTDDLGLDISSLEQRPYTTLLLKSGCYRLLDPVLTSQSVQIIGVEDNVEIDFKRLFQIRLLPDSLFDISFQREKRIHVHFENVSFVSGSAQIGVISDAIATFYRCKISNGFKGCDDFPRCNGGRGCINIEGKCYNEVKHTGLANYSTGQVGHPGIWVSSGGKLFVHNCVLDRCGGGGVLSDGDGAYLEIRHCTLRNMRQSAVEARNGGKVKVEDNVIIDNQFHGVAISNRSYGIIRTNLIQGNRHEGIYCGGMLNIDNQREMKSGETSQAIITENTIIQNGLSGISLDGGTYEVSGNKIIDNWLWGMMVKSRSSVYIEGNDIFENKCGGIRIGTNYSASVIIDGNTIRDHTGPAIFAKKSSESGLPDNLKTLIEIMKSKIEFAEERLEYSRPPIITNRNIKRNNNTGVQHPKKAVQIIQSCCSCFRSSLQLKKCCKCGTATYCSKECQKKHWKKHKYMCTILHKEYTIQIKMKDTKPFMKPGEVREFDSSLIGIMEGPIPNPLSTNKFIVKVQSGQEYGGFDPNKVLMLYDRSVTLDINLSNSKLYHLVNECGILAGGTFTTKKIFCWASFKCSGAILCIHTNNLPPFQSW
ncbi:unnamed protein product [Mytilus edulis]|uniref:MYND-type domain-containing protein n=1 Tax=Mytilus edulis TaxID=6550 RepID=A0A8S3SN23_MYTED|nr:unnamed protein product [Mytilus edulis]